MSLQPSSPAVPTQRKGRFHGASINLFYLPVIILLVVFNRLSVGQWVFPVADQLGWL